MRSCSCPNCNANFNIEEDNRDFAFCQYCGTKIMLDDYRSSHRIIDEARLKEAETERIIRLRKLELEEAQTKQNNKIKNILLKIWLVVSITIILIGIGIMFFGGEDGALYGFFFLFYVGAPIVGGGAVLIFKVIPEKMNEKILLNNGGIRFPKSLESFSGQNYIAVQHTLQRMGFKNITCINLHDVVLGLFQKADQVESISVNGEEIVSAGKIYSSDADIVITYHGR